MCTIYSFQIKMSLENLLFYWSAIQNLVKYGPIWFLLRRNPGTAKAVTAYIFLLIWRRETKERFSIFSSAASLHKSIARAGVQAEVRCLELLPGIPWMQVPKHMGHPSLLPQTHQQGAGTEVGYPGLKPSALTQDSGITGRSLANLAHSLTMLVSITSLYYRVGSTCLIKSSGKKKIHTGKEKKSILVLATYLIV